MNPENDTAPIPTIYLDRRDLADFLQAGTDPSPIRGFACGWEGENVFHLRVAAPEHAYGRTGTCLFARSGAESPAFPPERDTTFAVLCQTGETGPEGTVFRADGSGAWRKVPAAFIPGPDELYSRGKGLLETGALARRRVLIVGLGSFGSQIAVDLAKCGVGSFSLMDFDRLEPHNLMRHACGARDLGRRKTDAVRDAILGKNPYAIVDRFPIDAGAEPDRLEQEVARADLVVCATDNNPSRFAISGALLRQAKTGLFGRAVTRAEGGDVFRYRPGGPCYGCLIGNGWFDRHAEEIADETSARRSGRIPAYMSAEDAAAVVQVGLAADIAPICNLMVKLAILELSRGTDSGLGDLENELPYDYYMWANRRERRHANWAPFDQAGVRPTILRWYGARIARNDECAFCGGARGALDEGDDIEARLAALADSPEIPSAEEP